MSDVTSRSRKEREAEMARQMEAMSTMLNEMRDQMATLNVGQRQPRRGRNIERTNHGINEEDNFAESHGSGGSVHQRNRRIPPRHRRNQQDQQRQREQDQQRHQREQVDNPFHDQSDVDQTRHQPAGRRNDNDLGGLKLRIPPFYGKNDPDAFLEWEKKIDIVFGCQNFTDRKKINLAATEFHGYAVDWWDQIVTNRRRNGERPVETWAEMTYLMRRRFVPTHYHRELHTKLRRLSQGTKNIEDYYQEMERLMLKADIEEPEEATMARFLSGMVRDIQDRMEMQDFGTMAEMYHKAVLVEQQLRRKTTMTRPAYGSSSRPSNREEKPTYPTRSDAKPRTDYKPSSSAPDKGKAEAYPARSRDIECFKCRGKGHYASRCPNQRAMVMLDTGEIVSEDEENNRPVYDDEAEEEIAAEGELLVARRILVSQEAVRVEDQRENLFHTRCKVRGKICSLVIDGGSCTNVASQTMVDKLNLETKKHPHPYNLRWINNQRQLKVTKQVSIPFTIGRYEDEVLCDVLPMEAGHILLGRPWQYDHKTLHDGFTNKYSFEHNGRKVILAPLSPHDVYLDQVQLERSSKGKDTPSEPLNTSLNKNESESSRKTTEKALINQPVRNEILFVRPSEIKRAMITKQPIILLMFKQALTSTTNSEPVLPSNISSVLQEFADVFPEDNPGGLPPIRGIEHQIDFVPGASLPNRPAYRTNPVETKELQRQVDTSTASG